MILNTTGVSNDLVPSHEIQANVFGLIGSLLVTKLVFSLLFCLQSLDIPPEPALSSGIAPTEAQHCSSDLEIRPKKQ